MDEELQNQQVTGVNAPANDRQTGEADKPQRRPFEDASDLNSIPGIRPEDPPYRHFWIDEDGEPRKG